MGRINILDKDTVNKISAGEVIENPAAIVKELVENAIDAKANSITVELKDGGISLIRVTDNGIGIKQDEIEKAFLPHATSKIRNAEDLFHIESLGFRGEALPSIAAVAKVEALSKTAESLSGARYVIEGGEGSEVKEIGIPDGTTFVVRDIFYNTPARQKFLKSPTTEGRYVLEVMEHIAMSHPNISFKFILNSQVKFQTVGNGNVKDVLFYMYGKEVTNHLFELPFFSQKEGYSVSGFIGKPSFTRGNREYLNYFINGRYIKNKMITKAIETAYKPFIMGGKYPFTCLFLSLDTKLVDVNVHPSKLEVRFSEPDDIFTLIFQSITECLKKNTLIPDASKKQIPEKSSLVTSLKQHSNYEIPVVPMPEPFEEERAKEWAKELRSIFEQDSFVAQSYEYNKTSPTKKIDSHPLIEKEESLLSPSPSLEEKSFDEKPFLRSPNVLPDIKFIGQIFSTYWIVQYGDKVYMIDQHAAHEKVLYERFLKKVKMEQVVSQNLYPPVIVRLSASQAEVYSTIKEEIAALGFEIDDFGGNEYAMKAVPSDLFGLSEQEAFFEIVDGFHPKLNNLLSDSVLDTLATRACKAAIKGNNTLSEQEAVQLIKDLMLLENPYHCPHGRPTMIFMSKEEIEKKFKRKL